MVFEKGNIQFKNQIKMIDTVTGQEYTLEESKRNAMICQPDGGVTREETFMTAPIGVDLVIETPVTLSRNIVDHKELYDYVH